MEELARAGTKSKSGRKKSSCSFSPSGTVARLSPYIQTLVCHCISMLIVPPKKRHTQMRKRQRFSHVAEVQKISKAF